MELMIQDFRVSKKDSETDLIIKWFGHREETVKRNFGFKLQVCVWIFEVSLKKLKAEKGTMIVLWAHGKCLFVKAWEKPMDVASELYLAAAMADLLDCLEVASEKSCSVVGNPFQEEVFRRLSITVRSN